MGDRYNGGWEGPRHYRDWMTLVFDEDYDAECDPEARLMVSYTVLTRTGNCATACSALLNQWQRAEQPEAWNAGMAFLDQACRDNAYTFERQADGFLRSICHLSPGTTMQGERRHRDFLAELGR